MQFVPEKLRAAAATYEERNKLYGDNYKHFGFIMARLFPSGVKLETPDEHNRFGVFVQIVSKVTRYAANFETGGHPDSLHDAIVYNAMLAELDAEIALREDEEQPVGYAPEKPLYRPPSIIELMEKDEGISITDTVGWWGSDDGVTWHEVKAGDDYRQYKHSAEDPGINQFRSR